MENFIHITDNCIRGLEIENEEDVRNLSSIVGKNISQLAYEENLLIFPHSLSLYGDRLGNQTIGSLQIHDGKAFLYTGNVMGFIGKGRTHLRISSRFDKESPNDNFLMYMLCKVMNINLFNLNYSCSNNPTFDILIYLFPYYLDNALQKGLYKEYKVCSYNDSNVKGAIDINQHIKLNALKPYRIAYHTREYTCDNALTKLIRYTIEYILHHPNGKHLLQRSESLRENISQIIQATPSYSAQDKQRIISQNLRPKIHPYYAEYYPLQRLCLQILRQDNLSIGQSESEISGVLFDGAWLWEEYLNTVLKPLGFYHPRNNRRTGRVTLFNDGQGARYPDFYHKETNMVLDAKYKRYEDKTQVSSIGRDDLHQIITYMHILQSVYGGVVFPSNEVHDVIEAELEGYGGKFILFPFYLKGVNSRNLKTNRSSSVACSWRAFITQMKQNEKIFKKLILTYISK